MDDVDDRHHVAALARPEEGQDEEAETHQQQHAQRRRRPATRTGVHSNADPHGLTASDTGDASLRPAAPLAKARQTYSVPLVRSGTWVVVPSGVVVSAVATHVAPPSAEHS